MVLSVAGLILTGNEMKKDFSTKNRNMKLNAGIITSKLQETKKFYQEILNFSVKFEMEWFVLLQTPGGEYELSFLEPGHPSQKPIFQPEFAGMGVYLTIEVENVDDEYKRIKELKVPIEVDLRDEEWGDRHFAIVDPNGIGIDIVKYGK
jgi:catechol 2,3-dioxygenase-like lactoylglutathione lyase family enzyme